MPRAPSTPTTRRSSTTAARARSCGGSTIPRASATRSSRSRSCATWRSTTRAPARPTTPPSTARPRSAASARRRPAELEIALIRPDSYAPGDTYSSDSAIVIEQLFRGLLRIDHDLNVVPELAQNMNVSADGLTYLFMLREDACWSDGHPLTAGDFVYAWRRLREEGHVTAFLLDDIASAEALDDWTLEVHLREPRNYFPYVLASHWAYPWPRHRADEVGAAWRLPESLVGNGPFVLAEVERDGRAPDREPALARRRRATSARCGSSSAAATTSAARAVARGPLRPAARARGAGGRGRHDRRPLADALDPLPRLQRRPRADGRRARAPGARARDRQHRARGRRRRASTSPRAAAARSLR